AGIDRVAQLDRLVRGPVMSGLSGRDALARQHADAEARRAAARPDSVAEFGAHVEVEQRRVERDDVAALSATAQRLQRSTADHVLELADIARPGVSVQRLARFGRQAQAA